MLGKVIIKIKEGSNVNLQLRDHILLNAMIDGTFDQLQKEINKDKALDIATIKGVNYSMFNKFGDIAGSITGYGLKSFAAPMLDVQSFLYENLGQQSMDHALRAQYDPTLVNNPNEIAQRVRANRFLVNAVQASLLDYPSLTDPIHISTTPNTLLRELFDNPLAASKYIDNENQVYNIIDKSENVMSKYIKTKLIFDYKATPIVDPIIRLILQYNNYQNENPTIFGTDIHNMRRVVPANLPYTEISYKINNIKDLFELYMALVYIGFSKAFAGEIKEFMGYVSPQFNIATYSSRQKKRGIPFSQFESHIQDMLRSYIEIRDNSYNNFRLIIVNAAKIALMKKLNIPNPELIKYKDDNFNWLPDLSNLDIDVLMNLIDRDLSTIGVAEGKLLSEEESLSKLGVVHTLDVDYESLKEIKNSHFKDRYNVLINGAVKLLRGEMPFNFFSSDYVFTDKNETILINSISFERSTSELNGKMISSKRKKYTHRKEIDMSHLSYINRHFPKGIYARSSSSFGGVNNFTKISDGLVNITHQHLIKFYENFIALLSDFARVNNKNVRFDDIQKEFEFEYDPLIKGFIFRNAALDNNYNVARDGWLLDSNGKNGTYRTFRAATQRDNNGKSTLIELDTIDVYDENNKFKSDSSTITDIKFDMRKTNMFPIPEVTQNSFDNFKVDLKQLTVVQMLSIIASNQGYSRKYYNLYKSFAHYDLSEVYSNAILENDGEVKIIDGKIKWKKKNDDDTPENKALIKRIDEFDENSFLEVILPNTYWITPKFNLLSTYHTTDQYFALQSIKLAMELLNKISNYKDADGNSVLSVNSSWMTDDSEYSISFENEIFEELVFCKAKIHSFYYNLKNLVEQFKIWLLEASVNNIQLPIDYLQKVLFIDGENRISLNNSGKKEMKVGDVITFILSNPMLSEENIKNSIAHILRRLGINKKVDGQTSNDLYELISMNLDLTARIDTSTHKLKITNDSADDEYFDSLLNEAKDDNMNPRPETYRLCLALKDLCEGSEAIHVEFVCMKIEELRRAQDMIEKLEATSNKATDKNKKKINKLQNNVISLQDVINQNLNKIAEIYKTHASALLFTSFKEEIEEISSRLRKTKEELRKAPQMRSYQILKNMALDNLDLMLRLLKSEDQISIDELKFEEHLIWSAIKNMFK